MPTMITDTLQDHRIAAHEHGPPLWAAAWDRTCELVGPLWAGRDLTWDGWLLRDGSIALALGQYLLAAEQQVPVTAIDRSQLDTLHIRPWSQRLETWQHRLAQLGHDLDDTADPVARTWHALATPRDNPANVPDEVATTTHPEAPLCGGLDAVLAPSWNLMF